MERENPSFLGTFQGVVAALLAYGFAHSVMRLLASWNLGENDPVSFIHGYTLAALQKMPSIFDGLLWGLLQVGLPAVMAFQLLRYGLLAIALALVFLIARRITGSGWWAFLTVESYALIYQISWRFHEGFTYPLVTIVAVAAVFLCLIRQSERGYHIMLVIALGVGILTGFWFWVFLLTIAIAALFLKSFDVFTRMILFIAGIIATGLLAHSGFHEISTEASFIERISATLSAVLKVIAYLSPLLPILLFIFGRAIWMHRPKLNYMTRLMLVAGFIGTGLVVIAAFVTGKASYGEHALMPVFFLLPIVFMDIVRQSAPKAMAMKLFTMLCVALMLVAFGARAANLYVLDPVCKRCYFGIPYARLATGLEHRLSMPEGTSIVSPDPRIVGNLGAFFERAEKYELKIDQENWLEKRAGHARLLVWDAAWPRSFMEDWLQERGAEKGQVEAILNEAQSFELNWPHPWREDGYRTSVWKVAFISDKP